MYVCIVHKCALNRAITDGEIGRDEKGKGKTEL